MSSLSRKALRNTFSDQVSDEAIESFLKHAEIVEFGKKEIICRQGERADAMFVMISGCVGVYSEIENQMYQIDIVRSGTFGEIALLLQTYRQAFIITREDTKVIRLNRSAFKDVADQYPEVMIEITQMMLSRLIEQDKRELVKLKERTRNSYEVSSSTTYDLLTREKIINSMIDDIGGGTVARVLFSRISPYGAPSRSAQYQTDVFMIMPFKPELKPIYGYVSEVCKELDLTIKRGDDFFSNHAIMAEIWSVTNMADLIVCDCTGKNANVFYELGLAHALGKKIVLITQNIDDIPFDLRQFRFIVYEATLEGALALKENLRTAITTQLGLS